MAKRLEKRQKMREQQKKKKTKILLGILALSVVIIGIAAWLYVEGQKPPEITSTASLLSTYEFTMRDIDGTQFSLKDYSGDVILLHLMAVGCAGQVNQINDNQLTQIRSVCNSYCGSKPLTIVSVAVATCENSRLSWLQSTYGIDWFFGNDYDDGTIDIAQNYGIYGDGTIILIDKDFKVHEAYSSINAATLKTKINQLLEA